MEDRIEINGIAYVREQIEGEKLRIVIADNRGLAFVGHCGIYGDSEWILIRHARCIIRWGTSQHLAEIASGPTDSTVFGKSHDVFVRRANIVAVYDCGSGWNA